MSISKRNKEYWRKRFKELESQQHKTGLEFQREIEEIYRRAILSMEKDISYWYQRFANENGVSLVEAKRLLNTRELEEFRWSVEEYIQKGRENALNKAWMHELENASAKVHITRLECLKMQMQHHVENMTANVTDCMKNKLLKIYSDGYYKTIFEIQKGTGISSNFAVLNTNLIEKYLNKPWAPDGKNFSDRVWKDYKPKLMKNLENDLTQSIIRGDDVRKVINKISKDCNVSKSAAGRLVMTETAAMSSRSALDGYKQTGVKRFEVVAAFDSVTCTDCGSLDGSTEEIEKYLVGVTAPPFHPNCRCTTVPYFDDIGDITTRAARDENGEYYEVEENITYNEWKDKYVNKKAEKYIVKSQKIKYNKINERDTLKENHQKQPETFLQKQLSYFYNGEKKFIPNDTIIKEFKIIAGNGSSTELRDVRRLVSVYGGNVNDWKKVAGKVESDKYIFDVHWYEFNGKQYEMKLKQRKEK